MRKSKFTRSAARMPPLPYSATIRGVFQNSRISISVGDEDVSVRGKGHIGSSSKWAACIRYLADNNRKEPFASGRVFDDTGSSSIHRPNVPTGVKPETVRQNEITLSPRTKQITFPIEEENWVSLASALNHINGTVSTNRYPGYRPDFPTRRRSVERKALLSKGQLWWNSRCVLLKLPRKALQTEP
jgi:hypothetical protein